jgi:hypothetical protein
MTVGPIWGWFMKKITGWKSRATILTSKIAYTYHGPQHVCYHVGWCTKNKRMIWIPSCGLFLTCTQSLLFYKALTTQDIIISKCVLSARKKIYILTWKGGPFFMVANPHPPWSIAWSQLPFCSLALPSSPHPLPANRTFIYIQGTLTQALLLSGTLPLN